MPQISHIRLEQTDSTNRYLRELASKEQALATANDMIVVTAEYQTAGRGCGRNSWESERGKNLLFSLLCHPSHILPSQQFVLSMMISVAITEVLKRFVAEVTIKWPNDIYVGDRKIAGILIECRVQGGCLRDCLIGVGLNANQTEFLSDAPNPVSLMQLIGHTFDIEQLLQEILETFQQIYTADCREDVAAKYKSLLYRRTGSWPYADKNGSFLAELVDVTEDGTLILCDKVGQERHYAFKEVAFMLATE